MVLQHNVEKPVTSIALTGAKGAGRRGAVRRLAVLFVVTAAVLAVAIGAPALADDDDVLETPPPSEGIKERVEALEREWAEDVGGIKDPDEEVPEPAPLDDAHDAARGVEPDPSDAPETPKGPVPSDEPPPRKAPTPLESPLQRPTPVRPVVRGVPRPAPPDGGQEPMKSPAKHPLERPTGPAPEE
jgi:hypothetical protein